MLRKVRHRDTRDYDNHSRLPRTTNSVPFVYLDLDSTSVCDHCEYVWASTTSIMIISLLTVYLMFYLFCVLSRKQDKNSLKLSNILGYEQGEIAEMSKILKDFFRFLAFRFYPLPF